MPSSWGSASTAPLIDTGAHPSHLGSTARAMGAEAARQCCPARLCLTEGARERLANIFAEMLCNEVVLCRGRGDIADAVGPGQFGTGTPATVKNERARTRIVCRVPPCRHSRSAPAAS